MERKQFLKTCLVGVSSCVVCGMAAPGVAADRKGQADDRALDAVRIRYAALVDLVKRHASDEAAREIFRGLGRECARQFKGMTYEKFGGNLAGFLAEARGPNGWMASAEHDEKAGIITIVDRATSCTCPLVKRGLTPGMQCECTLGWQEETYSRIVGWPVKASLVESILRGDKRCVFRIEVLSANRTPGRQGS